jgi:hypothetical protein
MNTEILKAIAVTAEMTQTEFSKQALMAMVQELSVYPETEVLNALRKCYREIKSRLTLADIIERVELADGRPKADEAWVIAIRADDERETVVWTDEMQQAFNQARPSLEMKDETGARMAFKDTYNRLVSEARANKVKAHWNASLGWDAEKRQSVLESAVAQGKLPSSFVAGLLPPPDNKRLTNAVMQLASVDGKLVGNNKKPLDKESARKKLADIKAMLQGGA